MTVSEKQLQANQQNAIKGGVKTPEGKEIVKFNALKHGLLAKETVITIGEGAENPQEFNDLLEDLKAQLSPAGTLEEILTEKIAVAYWRLRRAYKYEVGLIRQELDTATDDFYDETNYSNKKVNKTDEELDRKIDELKECMQSWAKDKKDFTKMHKDNKPIEDIFEWEDNWAWLQDKYSYLLPDDDSSLQPEKLRDFFNKNTCWNDDQIWQEHIDLCNEKIDEYKAEITDLEKQKRKNKFKLQVINKLGNIPSKNELDRLLRYEGTIERQLYKALNQLERMQRLRAGDNVPPPLEVDLDVNADQN